jgi:hypothetical protein
MKVPIKALFSSWSANIGDDVQTFAAEQMLGEVDGYVDRENISGHQDPGVLVANGWWKHRPEDFPPAPSLSVAYVGIHVSLSDDWIRKHRDHFRNSGRIGCRDKSTLEKFRRVGIPAYLSNCLTLGLERWIPPDPSGPVVAVDVPDGGRLTADCLHSTHEGPINTHPNKVREGTRQNLEMYQSASLVITSRLHVALPCLAFGTPLCFIPDNPEDPRFDCVHDLVPRFQNNNRLGDGGFVLTAVCREMLRSQAKDHLLQSVTEAKERAIATLHLNAAR